MEDFQSQEGLTGKQFKKAVEEVGEEHPFLVKMMIASWEFPQFLEMCKVKSICLYPNFLNPVKSGVRRMS